MNRRDMITAKLALSQIKMADKTLSKIAFPNDRDKNVGSDHLAYAKFHCGVTRSYLESCLGIEKGED